MVPGLEIGLWPWFLALDTYPLLPYHHPDMDTWYIGHRKPQTYGTQHTVKGHMYLPRGQYLQKCGTSQFSGAQLRLQPLKIGKSRFSQISAQN